MQQTTYSTGKTAWSGISLQLCISHGLVAAAAVGFSILCLTLGLGYALAILIASLAGGLLGLALTLNIQYGLYILELTLRRFAQGKAIEPARATLRWPLTSFFVHINALNARLQEYARQQQLTTEFREQLLRQASEAAALEERNRIARDLHDSIKQQIFSISMSAAAAKAHWQASSASNSEAREAVEDIQRSAKEAQVEMQALLQQLRSDPLENVSLVDALNTQAQALGYRIGARMVVDIQELPSPDRLLPGTQEGIFRLVQEAFANISRHARAKTVWLSLYQRDNALHIEIRDDGQGFDVETVKRGMGLSNLYERAKALQGATEIQSAAGQGTTIHIRLPLIEALQTSEEQERSERELQRSIEQAKWSFQLSENASLLTIALIAVRFFTTRIDVPFYLPSACCLAVLYGYIQGRYYLTRVALNTDSKYVETLTLRLRDHSIRLWMLRIGLLGIWYIFLLNMGVPYTWAWVIAFAATLLLLTAFLLERMLYSRGRDAYYGVLPREELSWQVRQQSSMFARRWRFLLLAVAITVLTSTQFLTHIPAVPTFPPATLQGWAPFIGMASLVVWTLSIAFDVRYIRRWQRLLNT